MYRMRKGSEKVRHQIIATLAVGVFASACTSVPHNVARGPSRAALATCPTGLQQLDFASIRSRDLSAYGERVDADHARVRGPNHALPDLSGAPVVLRMYASGDPHQVQYTDTSSVVWKDDVGVWRAHAVDYRPHFFPPPRPPGETPYTRDEYEDLRREVVSGRLSLAQAERLEAALADPCLELQPDYVPMDAPDACMGGVSGGVIEITRNGATRRIMDGCARWTAGRLMRVVLSPQIEG